MRIFPETLKRSETFRIFPIYGPSTWLLKLKNACIYDRSQKKCTFTICSYPNLFAYISRGMKYPALPASSGPSPGYYVIIKKWNDSGKVSKFPFGISGKFPIGNFGKLPRPIPT